MNKSENITELATALTKAQAEMPAVPMNATNPFLKNRFADLGSVISTAQPILAKYGLAISQLTTSENGAVGVVTVLMHNSGQWLESSVSLPVTEEKGKSMAQVAGSVITYLRRYSLSAILNMYAEEDADGVEPVPKQEKKVTPAPKPSARQEPKSTTMATLPTESVADAKAQWDNFLAEYDITNEAALAALGTKTVGAWLKLNSGKHLDDAIVEVIAVMGLNLEKAA